MPRRVSGHDGPASTPLPSDGEGAGAAPSSMAPDELAARQPTPEEVRVLVGMACLPTQQGFDAFAGGLRKSLGLPRGTVVEQALTFGDDGPPPMPQEVAGAAEAWAPDRLVGLRAFATWLRHTRAELLDRTEYEPVAEPESDTEHAPGAPTALARPKDARRADDACEALEQMMLAALGGDGSFGPRALQQAVAERYSQALELWGKVARNTEDPPEVFNVMVGGELPWERLFDEAPDLAVGLLLGAARFAETHRKQAARWAASIDGFVCVHAGLGAPQPEVYAATLSMLASLAQDNTAARSVGKAEPSVLAVLVNQLQGKPESREEILGLLVTLCRSRTVRERLGELLEAALAAEGWSAAVPAETIEALQSAVGPVATGPE